MLDSVAESYFARAYAIAAVFIALYIILAGALRGGNETRPPFVAKVTGAFFFLLGVTYVFGVHLGYGVIAAYAAIVADFAWRIPSSSTCDEIGSNEARR